MTFDIYSFWVFLTILYVNYCYLAILIILKTLFTFRSISDRSRQFPDAQIRKKKMYQMFRFFVFIHPYPCRNEMVMGLSCAGSYPSWPWNSGGPVTLRDPGLRYRAPLGKRGQHRLEWLPRCMFVSPTGPHCIMTFPNKNIY